MIYQQPLNETNVNASYVDADITNGTRGSCVGAKALEHPQREIVNAIIESGLTPDSDDLTQLYQAILSIVNNRIPSTVASKADIDLSNISDDALDLIAPAGRLLFFPASVVPTASRLLMCSGGAISRTDYARLFAVIGTSFGEGDGSTTFNLPDYRGKFLRMNGGNSGGTLYTAQGEGLPNLYGEVPSHNSSFSVGTWGMCSVSGASAYSPSGNTLGTYGNTLVISASLYNAIYGSSLHVTPENFAVNYYITY